MSVVRINEIRENHDSDDHGILRENSDVGGQPEFSDGSTQMFAGTFTGDNAAHYRIEDSETQEGNFRVEKNCIHTKTVLRKMAFATITDWMLMDNADGFQCH